MTSAKKAKQDEFYTQYVDIQKEVEAYLEFDPDTFRGKIVYCNCDDPFESNFFKYFAANFNKLGLKKLVSTSYDGSPIAGQGTLFPEYNEGNGKRQKPKALTVILDHVKDEDGDGAANIDDVKLFLKRNKAARIALKADDKYAGGDFRSPECLALLKQADIIVTNPAVFPLQGVCRSARRVRQEVPDHRKHSMRSPTWRFSRSLKKTDCGLDARISTLGMFFEVPDHWERFHHIDKETGKKIARVSTSCWYPRTLTTAAAMNPGSPRQWRTTWSYSRNLRGKAAYDRYENYDAIEVSTYKEIPSDYEDVMGDPSYLPRQVQPRAVRDRRNPRVPATRTTHNR